MPTRTRTRNKTSMNERTNERYDKEIEFNKKRSLAVLIFERTKKSVGVFPFSCGAQLCFVCVWRAHMVLFCLLLPFLFFLSQDLVLSCFLFFSFLLVPVWRFWIHVHLPRCLAYIFMCTLLSYFHSAKSVYDDCSILFVHHFLC